MLQPTVTFLEINWMFQRQREKVGKRWTHHKIVRMSVQAERTEIRMAMVLTSINREGWGNGTSSELLR